MGKEEFTVKTEKQRLFPSDAHIMVVVKDKSGKVVFRFGIWKRTVRGMTFYDNDTFTGITFKTITEAKQYALRKAKK